MGTNGASALKYTTTCRLPKADGSRCGHQIIDHPLNVQIIGKPDQHIQNFIGALMRHVEKKHPEAWVQIQGTWQFFLGFLIMGQFETADPAIVQAIQMFGVKLRSIVPMPPISDAMIDEAFANIGFTMEDAAREKVIGVARNIRAYYEGTLQKPVEPEGPKPLVTL